MTASGGSPWGCNQPCACWGDGGRFLSFPWGSPALTHATRVLMSCWLRRASLRNFTLALGSAGHGGISCNSTFSLIALAQGRAASYDSNETPDPISPCE